MLRSKALLVWDHFAAHLTDGIKKNIKSVNTDVAVITGGLTSILQPLDVCLNKPFKDGLRRKWQDWIASANHTFTKAGNMRAASLNTCALWVKEAWAEIEEPTVINSNY